MRKSLLLNQFVTEDNILVLATDIILPVSV